MWGKHRALYRSGRLQVRFPRSPPTRSRRKPKRLVEHHDDSVGFFPEDPTLHPGGDAVSGVQQLFQSLERQNELHFDLCSNRNLVLRKLKVRALRRDISGLRRVSLFRSGAVSISKLRRYGQREALEPPLVSHQPKYT